MLVVIQLPKTGKKEWIHRARRSDNYGGDDDDKQILIDILRDNFGIHSVRGDVVHTIRNTVRYPDVTTTDYLPTLYLELDGEYHGFGDDISTSNGTFRRNKDYEDLGYRLIVINKLDTDGYNKRKIVALLKAHGIRDQR